MSIGQHLAEHPVSIIVAFIGTLALTIIDPCIHNDFTFQVVAEKQPILLKEFGAEPVLMMAAQSMALPVLAACGVLWNHVKRQSGDGGKAFARVLVCISDRIFQTQALHLLC